MKWRKIPLLDTDGYSGTTVCITEIGISPDMMELYTVWQRFCNYRQKRTPAEHLFCAVARYLRDHGNGDVEDIAPKGALDPIIPE